MTLRPAFLKQSAAMSARALVFPWSRGLPLKMTADLSMPRLPSDSRVFPVSGQVFPEPENIMAVFVFVNGIIHQVLCDMDSQASGFSFFCAEGDVRRGSCQRIVRDAMIDKGQKNSLQIKSQG